MDARRLLQEHAVDFEALGFEFENFGGASYVVRAIPAGLENRDPEQVLQEIFADLSRDAVKNVRETLLTVTACRGAIKFGDSLTMAEMEALLSDMEKTTNPTHCPHGRPSLVTFQFDRLESMFKRRNF
jgi:DNA mismatch repair protein MutL